MCNRSYGSAVLISMASYQGESCKTGMHSTFVRSWYPGSDVHYQLICVDHAIDVVALEEPIIHLDQSTQGGLSPGN
jgi:hypothetical protein